MPMLPEQVEYVNLEVFGGVNKDSYDLSAECIKIENGLQEKLWIKEKEECYMLMLTVMQN